MHSMSSVGEHPENPSNRHPKAAQHNFICFPCKSVKAASPGPGDTASGERPQSPDGETP